MNEIGEKGKNFKTQTRKQSQNIGLIAFKLAGGGKNLPRVSSPVRLAILNNKTF
jgi:hypothetical protein